MQSAAGYSAAYIPNNCLFLRRIRIGAIHDVDEDEGEDKTNDVAKNCANEAIHVTGRIHVTGEAKNTARGHNERASIEDCRDNGTDCSRNHRSDNDLLMLQDDAIQSRFRNSAQARDGAAEPKAPFARILQAKSKRQAGTDDAHAATNKSKNRIGTDGHDVVDGNHDKSPVESKGNHNEAENRSEDNAAEDGAELVDRQYGSRKQRACLLDNGTDYKERDGGSNSIRSL